MLTINNECMWPFTIIYSRHEHSEHQNKLHQLLEFHYYKQISSICGQLLLPTSRMARSFRSTNFDGPPRKLQRAGNPFSSGMDVSPYGCFRDYPENYNSSMAALFEVGNNFCLQPPPPPPPLPTRVDCGQLRRKHEGEFVELVGKVKTIRMDRFVELKDSNGVTQLVTGADNTRMQHRFANMPVDAQITVCGIVRLRRNSNMSIPTGEVEVHVEDIYDIIRRPHTNTRPTLKKSVLNVGFRRNYSTKTSELTTNITSNEFQRCSGNDNFLQYFLNREHTCGGLTVDDIDKTVNLIGWKDANTSEKFFDLRDGYGFIQVVLNDNNHKEIVKQADDSNFLYVKGKVKARPPAHKINLSVCPTGDIEVHIEQVELLNRDNVYNGAIKALPNILDQTIDIGKTEFMDQIEFNSAKQKVNAFTYRTHNCGELSEQDIGNKVMLCGWLEFQRMEKFFTLRDSYGRTQILIPTELMNTINIGTVRFESIIKVSGTVVARPPDMRNNSMITGDIEVILESMELLNEAAQNLPFQVRNFNRAKENLRLEHRYIDLRFDDMQRNLRVRSSIQMKMREYLINKAGFVEVETPTLFRRTPGGAQEFVVPTRKAGQFYSLVQSPQQFKQMLMAGAVDRYFQIARCYRDESTRPDRQPEFTQLDIELSFTNREHIMHLVEEILLHCWPQDIKKISKNSFTLLKYDKAMEDYGSDKPDTRFDLKLTNISSVLSDNKELLENDLDDFGAYAIVLKQPFQILPNSLKKEYDLIIKQFNVKSIFSKIYKDPKTFFLEKINHITEKEVTKIIEILSIQLNDAVALAYGRREEVQTLMGRMRLAIHKSLVERKLLPPLEWDDFRFLWVIDFPMFSMNFETKQLESVHHPFTAPHPDDEAQLSKTNYSSIRSLAYDLVLNGQEVGGGSIRIHDSHLQQRVLNDILKIETDHLKHLLLALDSGCPPHGGIALGLDRLLSIICNSPTIRDVIAFPKSFDGKDLLSKAPVAITDEELMLYNLAIREDSVSVDNAKNKKSKINET